MIDTARVVLWERDIGAVTWLPDRNIGVFQYTPAFAQSGIEVAPLKMPLRDDPYEFPALPRETFKGLPGMLADSLPDQFGNALIDAWLSRQGRAAGSFTPVERLCYTGSRGMGALEFKPALDESPRDARAVDIDALVTLVNRVMDSRIALAGKFGGSDDQRVIEDILRVGTSAGGARAKAVVAWNETTNAFRSGQAPAAKGYSQWLIKFDGIHENRDKELADPLGYGRIEYAYYRMAQRAGIDMQDCRLHEEGGRAHFMTRRFDRTRSGEKMHMQTLGAIRHYDFNNAGANTYEQVLQTIKRLQLSMLDIEQQVRRTFLNVLARNQDDHVKNIAFTMGKRGEWALSPAYDVAYSYNPNGAWTSVHQMSLNGKRDNFEIDDLIRFAGAGGIKPTRAKALLREVSEAISRWPTFASEADLTTSDSQRIERTFRRALFL